jgi:transcriptional regulator with XRE-family HTH domain
MSRLAAFGAAVRHRRVRLGLSQERLGFLSDLDRTYVSGIERGVRNPTLRTMWRLADALSTSPSVLLRASEKLADNDTA